MFSLGIMQGRLTPPKGRGIQFFPFENWENEFIIASQLGLSEIEFIFDYYDYDKNPLWTDEGIKKIKNFIKQTNVKVKSVCFDYFMRRAFFKEKNTKLKMENEQFLNHIITASLSIGASIIEIPLVDDSSIKTDDEKKSFIEFIRKIADINSITINLETDFKPDSFKTFLREIDRKNVKANYDSGNSSGLGYNPYEEVTVLKDDITNIHIKDREYKGTTRPLGEGSADFDTLFRGLKEINYTGSFILQAARDEDFKEVDNVKRQIGFVTGYIEKYLLKTE